MTLPLLYRLTERLGYRVARLRGSLLAARVRVAGGRCGSHLWVGRGVVLKYPLHCGITLGDRVRIGERCVLDVPAGAKLTVGSDVTLTIGVVLAASRDIAIGAQTLIGEYASVRDADHGVAAGTPIRRQPLVSQPVAIGADVWLGRGVCVLKGVTIGGGAVVGANAVVCKRLPPGTLSVGAPARVLCQWR